MKGENFASHAVVGYHPPAQPASFGQMTKVSPLLHTSIVVWLLSGCAYGYAGKEGKRPAEREYEPSVKVVTVKDDPGDEAADDTEPPQPPPAEPESPCGTPTFEIFYYSGTTQVIKTIDCIKRTIVDVQRTPIAQDAYSRAQADGLPEESWYLLVDPRGTRAGVLSNAQLLKLSRVFAIDYYGRDTGRDLLVYLYQQEDVQ